MMKKFKQSVCQCRQKLTWEPLPVRDQLGSYLVKDGVTLPNSVTEDIIGFSLAPVYSCKQLRRINRLQGREDRYNQGNLYPIRSEPESNRPMIKKRAFSEEEMR